jgi:anaerobic magnesium-protoporphyrin IX monomethyl ester cyclase
MFEPEMSYLSLPSLTAALRAAGHHPVQRDLNLESLDALLSEDFQRHCFARIEHALDELEAAPRLERGLLARYESLVRAIARGPQFLARFPDALRTTRAAELAFDPFRADQAARTLLAGFETVSAAYGNCRVGLGNFEQPGRPWDAPSLIAAAADRTSNPFPDLFEQSGILDDLCETATDALLLGISVVDSEQLVPALSLAALVRARLPALPILLGGPYLTKLVPEIEAAPELFALVDGVVVGEGEGPLVALAERLSDSLADTFDPDSFAGVTNVIYREQRREGQVRVNRPIGCETVRGLPTPDFTGLPLDRYWLPEPTLPISASRGCYWGRCTFCAHSFIYRARYATKRPATVAAEMAALHARHGARAFFFTDEGLSPPFVRGLAKELGAALPQALWGMEARFEAGFDRATLEAARDRGLRLIVFGLESFSERVLAVMAKGVERPVILRILEDCIDLGIAIHLWAIAGFPTERFEEAMETLELIFGHPRLSQSPDFSVGLNRFALVRHSAVEREPARFGIELLPRLPGEAFATVRRYREDPDAPPDLRGMTEEELDEVFRRFDLLERSLEPDMRRTGRVYHLLRRGRDLPPGAKEDTARAARREGGEALERPGAGLVAVRKVRFDFAAARAGELPEGPIEPLPRPSSVVGFLLDDERMMRFRGKVQTRIDEVLGDEQAGVLRLG